MQDEQKDESAVPGAAPSTPWKVLIVDDDDFLLNMYALKFKKQGVAVETALGPQQALSKLREGYAPDMLLVDVVMPSMDGIELLEAIKKDHLADEAVLIVLTNQSQQTDIERAKKVGVHGYIIKASTIPSEVLAETMKILEAAKQQAK
jgi:CheY-like chemotaxis protein